MSSSSAGSAWGGAQAGRPSHRIRLPPSSSAPDPRWASPPTPAQSVRRGREERRKERQRGRDIRRERGEEVKKNWSCEKTKREDRRKNCGEEKIFSHPAYENRLIFLCSCENICEPLKEPYAKIEVDFLYTTSYGPPAIYRGSHIEKLFL